MKLMPGLLARPLRNACAPPPCAAAAFILPALPAAAQTAIESAGLTVTLTPAVSNDYLFRGISQTRNNWAFQGTADIQHESGFYIGAFVSNAKFLANPYNDTRQELDALAGYRFELAGVAMDIGYVGYYYPGQGKAPGGQLNEYHELAVKAAYTIDTVKLLAAFNYSPNFFGRSGAGYYIEGGADVTLPYALTASARVGHQWIERNTVLRHARLPLVLGRRLARDLCRGDRGRRLVRHHHRQEGLRPGRRPRRRRPARLRRPRAVHAQPDLLTPGLGARPKGGAGRRAGAFFQAR